MITISKISIALFLFLVIIGVLMVFIYRILYILILPSVGSRKLKRFLTRWIYISELLAWLSFAIYAIYRLLLSSPVFTLVLLILLVVLGWQIWRDIMGGVLFRIDDKVKPGDTISINNEMGIIDKIGNRNIYIKSDRGELIVIPFQEIDQKGYRIITEQGKDNVLQFTILKNKMEAFGGEKELRKLLVSCPWASPLHIPEINAIDDANIEILVWATDPKAREKYKDFIFQQINGDQKK